MTCVSPEPLKMTVRRRRVAGKAFTTEQPTHEAAPPQSTKPDRSIYCERFAGNGKDRVG